MKKIELDILVRIMESMGYESELFLIDNTREEPRAGKQTREKYYFTHSSLMRMFSFDQDQTLEECIIEVFTTAIKNVKEISEKQGRISLQYEFKRLLNIK